MDEKLYMAFSKGLSGNQPGLSQASECRKQRRMGTGAGSSDASSQSVFGFNVWSGKESSQSLRCCPKSFQTGACTEADTFKPNWPGLWGTFKKAPV